MKLNKLLLACALAFGITSPALALNVGPLSTVYAPNHKGGVLTIHNDSDESINVEVIVSRMELVDGKQVRTPTNDIRFAPSVITLPPGKMQTVKYVHTNLDPSKELYYRILVKELESEVLPETPGVGMEYLMEYDFPWIWRGRDLQPRLAASWVPDGNGYDLVIENDGTATAQLVNIQAGSTIKSGLVGYVMPGERTTIDMNAPNREASVQLVVNQRDTNLEVR